MSGYADLKQRFADDGLAWPWCDACHSWHHPNNPTCKYRDPLYLQKQVHDRIVVREVKREVAWGMIIASIIIGAVVTTLLALGMRP